MSTHVDYQIAPYNVCERERTTYYYGISPDPPELLYRSDLLSNPFSEPAGNYIPAKSIQGAFNSPLYAVWDGVCLQICKLLEDRGINYSSINAVRFATHGEDDKSSLSPVVIWIATFPNSTIAKGAHDASPDILALLEADGVEGAVVEWYEEGVAERL